MKLVAFRLPISLYSYVKDNEKGGRTAKGINPIQARDPPKRFLSITLRAFKIVL